MNMYFCIIILLCNHNSVSYFTSFISPGITKVVASKYVKKHQINKGKNCGTTKIARCGLALGAEIPCFYLAKKENINLRTLKGNFSTKHGDLPGSKFIPTLNAYMTDKVWNDMEPAFSKVL